MCFFKESIKFAVLAFGIIFLLTGAALVSIGAIYQITFHDLSKAIPETYSNLYAIPVLTIVAGSLITCFTCFGCCGAIFDNRRLLITYAVLLVSVFILQVSIGIFTFVSVQDREDLSASINATVSAIFAERDADFINLVQSELRCCGPDGPSFWNVTMNLPFPQTCFDDAKVHGDGCQSAVFGFLVEAARVVGVATVAFSAAEVTGAVLAVFMANVVKSSARERRGYSARFFDEE